VFGHHLKPGEFEQMTSHDQKRTSDLIMDVIRRKLQERRERELKTGNV
jgi:metal-responsive CopG/Arc/MetJ family transcriptional regulator